MAQLKTSNVHGDLHVSGDITQEGNKVYHEGYKPTKGDVGLGSVDNYSRSYYDGRYATAAQGTKADNAQPKESGKGLSTNDYTSAEKTKLSGIATGATKNATDAQLRARSSHTGTQAISTVAGLDTALDGKVDKETGKSLISSTDLQKLSGIETGAQVNLISVDNLISDSTTLPLSANQGKVLKGLIDSINALLQSDDSTLDELQEIVDFIKLNREELDSLGITSIAGLEDALDGKQPLSSILTGTTASFTSALKTKLDAIASGATKNATDAQLRDRATHTGTQAISTISGLDTALDGKVDTTDARLTNSRDWSATLVTQAEAQAGTSTTARKWSAQRVAQAISALGLQIGTTATTAKAGNWNPTWSQVSSKPSTFTPSAHTHSLSQITDAGSVASLSTTGSTTAFLRGDGTWVTPPNTNTTYTEITTAEIDAGTASTLRTISGRRMKYALDKKSDTGHGHVIGDITGLQTSLDAKANVTDIPAWAKESTKPSYTKSEVGLGNVDNTSDLNKPISTDTQAALDSKANTSTQVIAGTGLSGGGTLDANRTLNVSYGTTAGTAAQGNDARLSNSREWTASVVSQAEAEAGAATSARKWTAQRVRQAIDSWWSGSTDKTKLDGIATGATKNATDAQLRARSSHTGTQAISTVSGLQAALDAKANVTDLSNAIPSGIISMWSGATDAIPSGWALCDGNNNTPDLRGRFVIGAGGDYAVDSTGGGSIPSHSHGSGSLATSSTGAHTHTGTAASAGAHTHTTSSAGGHSHSGTASSAGAHTHSAYYATSGDGSHNLGVRTVTGNSRRSIDTSSAGAHTHSLSINSAGAHTHTANSAGAHTHTVSVTSAGDHTHTISGSTAAYGSGSEVIAKYYALCYIMKL